MIDPKSLAFDIDGVFADTMNLFIDIARDEFNIKDIRYENITTYMLEDCLGIDSFVIEEIIKKLLDGNHIPNLKPISGSPEVLTRLCQYCSPITFVTARPYPGYLYDWMFDILPVGKNDIEIIATGSFDAKAEILIKKKITYFVEDRLETCFILKDAGITPVLFKQPWNRKDHPFVEVATWEELESLIAFT